MIDKNLKPNLLTFGLTELAQFTKEGAFAENSSKDFKLLLVGRDDVHGALKYVLSRVTSSLYLNMFGFDDEELSDIVMAHVSDPSIACFITLDKSQAGGVHERKILDSAAAKDPLAFNTHVIIGSSATHQISHTKGFVADGRVGAEGSTNWSTSGEGIGVVGSVGYKAQNNTQSFFTCPSEINRFQTQLNLEHLAAAHQLKGA